MHILAPKDPSICDWNGVFGQSRDHIIDMILRDNWLDYSHNAVLSIREEPQTPFSLLFRAYQDQEAYEQSYERMLRIPEDVTIKRPDTRFDVLFMYGGVREAIRLHDVFMGKNKHKKYGKKLLATAIVPSAIDLGCKRIHVEPDDEGCAYWTSRGALIFDTNIFCELRIRVKTLKMSGNYDVAEDAKKLIDKILYDEDMEQLYSLIDRDDLLINGFPARRALMHEIEIGECIFVLDHPRTQKCLLQRTGFDVAAALRQQCRRPVGSMPKTSGPAF